jgi:Holliday junction resolvase RusA-like endonuclease
MDYGWQTIIGNCPSKSNCYKIIKKAGHADLCKTDALKQYENTFYMQCGKYRNLNIDGYFEYHCNVYYPSMKSDLDNSLKVQLDCLQLVKAIKNDNRCVKIVAEKFIDKVNPRVEFKIISVEL